MSILSFLWHPAKHQTGVYKIVNRKTGWIYIGATTQPIVVRWDQHRRNLRGNRHHNSRLQADWNKYGSRAFRFVVVEVVDTDRVFIQERHWQRIFYATGECYNPNPDAPLPFMNADAPQRDLMPLYTLLRSHGFKREETRPLLKGIGLPLNNNLWAEAGRRTRASYYPDDPELEYQSPRG